MLVMLAFIIPTMQIVVYKQLILIDFTHVDFVHNRQLFRTRLVNFFKAKNGVCRIFLPLRHFSGIKACDCTFKSLEFRPERRDGTTPLHLMLMCRKSVTGVWEICCYVVQLKGGII